jgi:carbon-monoxide dehydrogenase medium subunit
MKLRLATPGLLVDIGRIAELRAIQVRDGMVSIGALVRHGELAASPEVRRAAPLLAAAAAQIGDPQVRHRGTIGGSLVHGDPASDLPAALLALGGSCVVEGPSGRRSIVADDLFTGFLETAVAPDELVTEVQIPIGAVPSGDTESGSASFAFEKFTRRAQDWAVVGVAVQRSEDAARVALVNMASTPMRAVEVENALRAGATAAEAATHADVGTSPVSDLNASEEYRLHLAKVLCRRALEAVGY